MDWDVRLDDRTDRSAGYYSYLTGMSERSEAAVCVSRASRAVLEGQVTFFADGEHTLLPSLACVPPRTYAGPADLDWLEVDCGAHSDSHPGTLEIGYFEKFLCSERTSHFKMGTDASNTRGLHWAHLSSKGRKKLGEAAFGHSPARRGRRPTGRR